MAKRKTSGGRRIGTWLIMGLLCGGMLSFGAAGLMGTARAIGYVGDKAISVTSYYNALTRAVGQVEQQLGRPLSTAEIEAFGLDSQALAQVVRERAMDNAAAELGVSVGDAQVLDQILAGGAFNGLDGTFDRVAYTQSLRRNNMREVEYEANLRDGIARTILQGAVLEGVRPPAAYADTLVQFMMETRDFTWVRITEGDLSTELPAPSNADLRSYHADNPDLFTIPASKRITYAWITPDMLFEDVAVDEADIAALYSERRDEFNREERRLIERLVFATEGEAEAALNAINAGDMTFEQAVESRGLRLADVDLGDMTASQLGAAAEGVFAMPDPGIVGPLPSSLGPALFRVNAILSAQVITLEDARDELRIELATDAAAGLIEAELDAMDDLLASGATLEDAAAETSLALGQIDWHSGVSDGIAAYATFRDIAAQVTGDDFPQLRALSDGGVFALRLDADLPPRLQRFDEVRTQVTEAFRADQLQTALMDEATARLEGLPANGSLWDIPLALSQETGIDRTDFIPGVPPSLIADVFTLQEGARMVIAGAGEALIVELNAINAADTSSGETAALRGIVQQQLTAQIAQEVLQAFAQGAQAAADVDLNLNTIQSINSSIRGGPGGGLGHGGGY